MDNTFYKMQLGKTFGGKAGVFGGGGGGGKLSPPPPPLRALKPLGTSWQCTMGLVSAL